MPDLARLLRVTVISAGLCVLALVCVEAVAAGPSSNVAVASAPPAPTLAPVVSPPLPSGVTLDTNTCATCHTAIDNKNHDIESQWQKSVHGQNGIACADCHGGDPTSDQVTVAMSPTKGFKGIPGREDTVALCGTCHSDVDRMRQYQIPTD